MIVGCYSTDIYCDFPDSTYEHRGNGGSGFVSITGRSLTSTLRKARKFGWRINKNNQAMCPHCVSLGRKLKPEDSF